MYWRWTAQVGLVAVLAPLTAMSTDLQGIPLADAEFLEWTGILQESILNDNSVLSEYIAQTHSQDMQGAVLQLAFVPRFTCMPLVRVIVPEQSSQAQSGGKLSRLDIDDVPFEFPVLTDTDSSLREYSFWAGHSGQQALRMLIDRGSHLQAQWAASSRAQGTSAAPYTAETVDFSLLGSRRSIEAVEVRCKSHEPMPFELPASEH